MPAWISGRWCAGWWRTRRADGRGEAWRGEARAPCGAAAGSSCRASCAGRRACLSRARLARAAPCRPQAGRGVLFAAHRRRRHGHRRPHARPSSRRSPPGPASPSTRSRSPARARPPRSTSSSSSRSATIPRSSPSTSTGARERIEALPWVSEATLRKLYPDTLEIEVTERKPFALWQRDGRLRLIEKGGRVITDQVDARYAALPLVVGEGADAPRRRVRRADRRASRRSSRGSRPACSSPSGAGTSCSTTASRSCCPRTIRRTALIQAVALDDGHGVFSRDIAAIDLRLPSRLVVRLTEGGARPATICSRSARRRAKKGTAA